MGRLDAFVDITGSMSPLDVNTENIQQIIDELNRNADQLDAISKGLNIIGQGSRTIGANTASQVNHGFGSAPIFLCFFNRDDQPGIFYAASQWFYDNTGNYQGRVYAYTDATNINLTSTFVAGAPTNVTFSWYFIQQPAQVPTGA